MDITLKNFEAELITGSSQQPILLDIWAPWCGPCKALGPLLEKLEVAYAGRFRLAKLNSDDQPDIAGQLSQMFGVRSIPFCVMFKDGQPVDGFVGALPEAQIREFLDRHVPSADEMAAERGGAGRRANCWPRVIPTVRSSKLAAALEVNPAQRCGTLRLPARAAARRPDRRGARGAASRCATR